MPNKLNKARLDAMVEAENTAKPFRFSTCLSPCPRLPGRNGSGLVFIGRAEVDRFTEEAAMIHVPIYERLPEIAERESRMFSISNSPPVPDGDYAIQESYCEDSDCDCRRVFLSVNSRRGVEAVIAFGWEDREFYARWMGTRGKGTLDELKGPCLNLTSPQSRFAPILLELVGEMLKEEAYVGRIKRHYALFKQSLRQRPESATASL